MKKQLKKLFIFGKESTKNVFLKSEKIHPQLLKKGLRRIYSLATNSFINARFV